MCTHAHAQVYACASWRRTYAPHSFGAGASGQVRLEQDVFADLTGGQALELDRNIELAEETRAVAAGHGCDEDEQLVDEPGREERGRKRGSTLEQQRLDTFRGERAELVAERAAAQFELRPVRERSLSEREAARL